MSRGTSEQPSLNAALPILAAAMAAVTATQAGFVAVTGEELCVGQGCALVGSLTRISPALFNLFGAGVFAAIGALALLVRRRPGSVASPLLHALLVAALSAEGVLFAYQWHVAGAWCTYCLFILLAVALLNVLYSIRGAVFGAAAFAASLTIFSLLSFIPFKSLEEGTFAIRESPDSPVLFVIFSEDCPHCQSVVEALQSQDRCAVRFNPVSTMPSTLFPDLPKTESYDPRVNVAAARILGLRTVPFLIAREGDGFRVVSGEQKILSYVESTCSEKPPMPTLPSPWDGGNLLGPQDDSCGLETGCP